MAKPCSHQQVAKPAAAFYGTEDWQSELLAIVSKHNVDISSLLKMQQDVLFHAIKKHPMEVRCSDTGETCWLANKEHTIHEPCKQIERYFEAESQPINFDKSSREGEKGKIHNDSHVEASHRSLGCLACAGTGCSICQPTTLIEEDACTGVVSLIDQFESEVEECEPQANSAKKRKSFSKASESNASLDKVRTAINNRKSRASVRGPASALLTSNDSEIRIDSFIGTMIVLNAMVLVVSGEWRGWLVAVELGIQNDDGSWKNAEMWFEILEHIFTAFFLAELMFQLFTLGRSFFLDWFNYIDAAVVLSSCVEMYVLKPLTNKSFGGVVVLRLLRIAKLLRTLRIIRTVTAFKGLRVLLKAVVSSLLSFFWSMVLLGVLIMMGGIMMSRLLEEFVLDDNNDYDMRLWCWTYYGTSLRATYTMFEVTLAGCWPNYVRPLLASVSHFYGLFFVLYISLVVFAVIRVITAIFLKETLDTAGSDADMMIAEKSQKMQGYLQKLQSVFEIADVSGDGQLSYDEFESVLLEPKVRTYLSALELEVHESSMLFDLLDDGDGVITYEEFVKGVSRLKGQARTLDLVAVQLDLKRVLHRLDGKRQSKHTGGLSVKHLSRKPTQAAAA